MEFVSADLFRKIDIAPALGRAFTLEEDTAGGAPIVILSDGLWRRRLRLTLIAVALGLAAALALTRVMKSLLFEVSETDPATFTLIALLLVVVALFASYIPARRATKVDPLQALRHE